MPAPETTVVIITRNRAAALRRVLARLTRLPERPPIVVVDNASSDDTARAIAEAGPPVRAVFLRRNAGAAGRNAGVAQATTPYIAFSDDDSWWAPGALATAARRFGRHARLGLIAARVLVGPDERLDPICRDMAGSALAPASDLPGPRVLGFLACGAVVRRAAFLQAHGFHPRYEVGGEERLLAIDLARRGWGLAYCADIVAHHHPEGAGERPGRRARMLRNDLWTTWLRRGVHEALFETLRAARAAAGDRALRPGLVAALAGLPWALRERHSVAPSLDAELSRVCAAPGPGRETPPPRRRP